MLSREKNSYGLENKGAKNFQKAYRRFFDGYSEMSVIGDNGKKHIVRTYTDDYYRQDLSKKKRITIRCLYLLLFFIAELLLVWNASKPLLMNFTWYVVLPQAVSVGFAIWIIIIFLSYLPSKGDMTIGRYNSTHKPLIYATAGAAIGFGLAAFACFLFFILNPSEEPLRVVLSAAKNVVALLAMETVNYIERRVKYLRIKNASQPAEGSIVIS